ncbi:MAG: alpha/beta hydrolase [Oculatellaceae cyanobacterium Prado106]|nr:alpha/beta hydrolase [Oculatellaceae cyanobacterium Prado106]
MQGFPHAYELSAPTDSPVVLVFVHGWMLSRAYWQPVIEQLSKTYQCLSYDLRGFGESQPDRPSTNHSERPTPPSPVGASPGSPPATASLLEPAATQTAILPESRLTSYTPAAYAQDLNQLLQTLKISHAWIIGHSLGGSIALWAADQAPGAIAGVICVNAGGGIYLKEEFERFRSAGCQLVKFRPRWLSYIPLLDLTLTRLNVTQPLEPRWGRQRLLDLLSALPEAALGALLESTTEAEVHLLPQVITRLQQPVHFIAGENDTVMEPQYVRHLASFHPSFECCGNNVTELPHCGHLAMVEQPNAVVQEILRVLKTNLG